MGSIQNTVYYCCVSRGNRILYVYSGGDGEIENLGTLCLEKKTPFQIGGILRPWVKGLMGS